MVTPAYKRLIMDLKKVKEYPPNTGISADPDPHDITKWKAAINGPTGTPWQSGVYRLSLEFTKDYPNEPPKILFVTPMFHPNIYKDGKICLDILQGQWSPIYGVGSILLSIQVFFAIFSYATII